MLVRQQQRHLLVREDCGQQLLLHLGGEQPVAALGKGGGHPHRLIDRQPNEPAGQQIALELLHQLALGSDREQDLHEARANEPLGRDRGPPLAPVEPLEIGVE